LLIYWERFFGFVLFFVFSKIKSLGPARDIPGEMFPKKDEEDEEEKEERAAANKVKSHLLNWDGRCKYVCYIVFF
jgi:hypothetical protein